MKDRLKRILIVGAGGVLGGLFMGILCRRYFAVVGVCIIGGLVGLCLGVASELTRKINELVRAIVRTFSCWGLLFALFWLFYFLENLPFLFRGLNIDSIGYIGHLAEIIYKADSIFISVVLGLSITEGLLKRQNVLIRVIAATVCGAFFCGIIVFCYSFIYSFRFSWEELYQGPLYGASVALGLIIGLILSEKIGKKKP